MMNYIDLHMHSIHSDDGEFTPKQLVEKCKEAGIKIMAIADHNSVKAIEEEIELCKEMEIKCIPAIEIDCTYRFVNLHVVGYGMDYANAEIRAIEENVVIQELRASHKKITLTNELGFNLNKEDLDEVSDNGIYTGEMFAEVLLSKKVYQDHEILKPYRKNGERSDNPYVNFYWDYYSQGKPCYVEIHYPTLEEVISLIHKYNGVIVLAHPGNNLKNQFELFDEMVYLGLDGVEVFSSYHTKEDSVYFYNKAKEYNLLVTCGSDFHGKTKPAIAIGGSIGPINQKEMEKQLKEYKLI